MSEDIVKFLRRRTLTDRINVEGHYYLCTMTASEAEKVIDEIERLRALQETTLINAERHRQSVSALYAQLGKLEVEVERLRTELAEQTRLLSMLAECEAELRAELAECGRYFDGAIEVQEELEKERNEWKRRAELMHGWMNSFRTHPQCGQTTEWEEGFVKSVPEAAQWFEDDE